MNRQGILMIVFGALDLFAFYRYFPAFMRLIEVSNGNLVTLLNAFLIISVIITGSLLLLGNKIGYVIYYFQFPLKLLYGSVLTFGFLRSIFPTNPGTLYFGMLWATIFALEAIRLMHTIQKHRSAG